MRNPRMRGISPHANVCGTVAECHNRESGSGMPPRDRARLNAAEGIGTRGEQPRSRGLQRLGRCPVGRELLTDMSISFPCGELTDTSINIEASAYKPRSIPEGMA